MKYTMIYIALLAAGSHAVSYSAGHLRYAWQKTGQVLHKTVTSLRAVPQMRRDFLDRTEDVRFKWAGRVLKFSVGGCIAGSGVGLSAVIVGGADREGALALQNPYDAISSVGLATTLAGYCGLLGPIPLLSPCATAALGASAGLVGGAAAYACYKQGCLQKESSALKQRAS